MNHRILFLTIGFLCSGPILCGASKATDPVENFEALWNMLNQRYAFFDLRGVDWKAQHEKYRPKVTKDTTDEELFGLLCEMLKPLKDGHVNLKAKSLGKKKTYNPEESPRFFEEFNNSKLEKQFEELVRKTLRDNDLGELKNSTDLLVYSRNKDLGYLLITEFEGARPKKLDAALDKVLAFMDGTKGLIIDIRLNPGGTDQCVYQIASRFADKKRVGHHRKTKTKTGPDGFAELKTRYLNPHGDTYLKPIILLTHDASFSGADVFAMVMTELPQVTLVGEPTNGIFSNMLEKKLPNGWKYTLSFQVYYSADMTCYEGQGIPVDIPMKNMRSDLEKGEDPLILKALELLSDK
ncbi:MAG: hypothetical protein HN531_12530 [Opitutae bacterium]|nr:hypothetical protein [Opitutae bacterium]